LFDSIKKHTRAKVNLDEETYKVWELLMLDINSDRVDGADEDSSKWWENVLFPKDKHCTDASCSRDRHFFVIERNSGGFGG
jgi:hypothetical protein